MVPFVIWLAFDVSRCWRDSALACPWKTGRLINMSTVDAPEGAMCTCPACVAGDTHPENMVWDDGRWVDFGSLDPDAGGTYAGKEIWDVEPSTIGTRTITASSTMAS
jgi:hypothetical protein